MAQGAIVFRWGPAVRGRENKALELFAESAGYWDDMVKNHRVEGHYPYISQDRSGGTWLIQGDTLELAAIREEEDYRRLIGRVQMIVEDFSVETCFGGSVDGLADVMATFAETFAEFS